MREDRLLTLYSREPLRCTRYEMGTREPLKCTRYEMVVTTGLCLNHC